MIIESEGAISCDLYVFISIIFLPTDQTAWHGIVEVILLSVEGNNPGPDRGTLRGSSDLVLWADEAWSYLDLHAQLLIDIYNDYEKQIVSNIQILTKYFNSIFKHIKLKFRNTI